MDDPAQGHQKNPGECKKGSLILCILMVLIYFIIVTKKEAACNKQLLLSSVNTLVLYNQLTANVFTYCTPLAFSLR